MAFKYTEDQLNNMDKTMLVELFPGLDGGIDKANTCTKREDVVSHGTD